MNAILAASNPAFDPGWYPESGATNNHTHDSNNLMTSMDYTGQEQIHMANGTGVSINHVGQTYF